MKARAIALALAGMCAMAAAAEPQWVGRFAALGEVAAPWRVERFDTRVPATQFRQRDWDGVAAVEAQANGSMALLARPVDVDLARTPVLCWRWRVDAPLVRADMATKAGDDYAARVYLSFTVPADTLGFGTRLALGAARALRGDQVPDAAVNYVWDNRYEVGTTRPNAYTDRARMHVLRSGAAQAGQWVVEARDVVADFTRAFGHAPLRLTGLALASDTDNTGETARAGFAEFRFVERAEACTAG